MSMIPKLISLQSRDNRLATVSLIGERSCAVNFKEFGVMHSLFGFHCKRYEYFRNETLALEAAEQWLESAGSMTSATIKTGLEQIITVLEGK